MRGGRAGRKRSRALGVWHSSGPSRISRLSAATSEPATPPCATLTTPGFLGISGLLKGSGPPRHDVLADPSAAVATVRSPGNPGSRSVKKGGIHCVVVDDHVMVLQMLCGLLRTLPAIEIVGTGTGLKDGDRLASLRCIDLLIVDENLGPDTGIELATRLRASHPQLKCMLLADGPNGHAIEPDLPDQPDPTSQAIVVIDKADPCEALLEALERLVVSRPRRRAAIPGRDHLRSILTARECEVFDSLGDGLSNKELAQHLGISVQTVETHRKSISKKLGCNGASLVRLATLSRHLAVDHAHGSLSRSTEAG